MKYEDALKKDKQAENQFNNNISIFEGKNLHERIMGKEQTDRRSVFSHLEAVREM